MRQAYYHSSIKDFLLINNDQLVGQLNKAGTSFVSQYTMATTSWASSIELLKTFCFELLAKNSSVNSWHILFEYEIPRLSGRIDAVLIAHEIIFVIEFKYDRENYLLADIRQVEDYANDLFDFHLESMGKVLIPILLAPNAPSFAREMNYTYKSIHPCLKVNKINFAQIIYDTYLDFHKDSNKLIDSYLWEQSPYQPTPTIVQAAKALFAGQKVVTITKAGADKSDLKETTDYLINVINNARNENKKIVCFVTGVPGAGKTLVGLNVVHEKEEFGGEDFNTAYFSGNGPLINVLREALGRDHYERQNMLFKNGEILFRPIKSTSEREVKSKIQNLHLFIKEGIRNQAAPTERIVIFDEAQRCWDAEQFSRKAKQNENREQNPFIIEEKSEAELLFEFMNRHEGWAVIIALVGGGQEINTGEGGIAEWGKAIKNKYSNWMIHISDQLLSGDSSTAGQTLFDVIPSNVTIQKNSALHLSVSQRSFKANNLNTWVSALINNKPIEAFEIAKSIKEKYPLLITRDISTAKEWLKQNKSGNKRIGLVASSGGLRLKPHGIYIDSDIDEAMWFLNDETDIRSSYYLEIVASEYKVQGLELDWVGLCWDADLRRINDEWDFKKFSGKQWNTKGKIVDQQFLLNSYRVLLTRAREGIVIFVPSGDITDATALPSFYDPIYLYLKACGLQEI